MSHSEGNNSDVFVQLLKADSNGKLLRHVNILKEGLGYATDTDVPEMNITKYLGPNGMIRASRREIDQEISVPNFPRVSLREEETLSGGSVIKLDNGTWLTDIVFDAGEKLVLKIAGHPMVLAEFLHLCGSYEATNRGKHSVHFGGQYESYIDVPFVEL